MVDCFSQKHSLVTLISGRKLYTSCPPHTALLWMLCSSFAVVLLAGQKRTPRRGEQQGWNGSRGTDVFDRAERRSYREHRLYDTERQADWTAEKFTDEKYVPQSSVRVAGAPEIAR